MFVSAGSGAYASVDGACVSTGDGDVMMRFLPCYQAVESLRLGLSPCQAAVDAIQRITTYYPDMAGAIVVTDSKGNHAAAASAKWQSLFQYCVQSKASPGGKVEIHKVCHQDYETNTTTTTTTTTDDQH